MQIKSKKLEKLGGKSTEENMPMSSEQMKGFEGDE